MISAWMFALALLLGTPLYEPPAPGSYELPVIDRVNDHVLIDSTGVRVPLLGLSEGQVALVAFVYRGCTDADGCPLSLAVLREIDRTLADRAKDCARLVTVSFDPARDTPEKMDALRAHMRPEGDWRFLIAASAAAIEPVLRDFGQDAIRELAEDGSDPGVIRHVLKVFLVDAQGGVRNVYSSGFLDARVILNDVETVLAAPEPEDP